MTHWKPISRGYYCTLISDSSNFCFRKTSPIALSSVMFKESSRCAGWQDAAVRGTRLKAEFCKWTSSLALGDTLFKDFPATTSDGIFLLWKSFSEKVNEMYTQCWKAPKSITKDRTEGLLFKYVNKDQQQHGKSRRYPCLWKKFKAILNYLYLNTTGILWGLKIHVQHCTLNIKKVKEHEVHAAKKRDSEKRKFIQSLSE